MNTFNKYTDENGVDQIEKIDELGNTSYVPADLANSDYQEYLKSLEDNEE
jgi:hypothetical protein